jgi:hypothetical protein
MEYRFIKLNNFALLFVILFFIFQSCGYLENDKTQYENTIIGNIKFHKQENDSTINLVFKETDEIYSVILDNCLNIYSDTINKKIFVECYFNDKSNNYYEIDIINPAEKFVSRALKKEKINIEYFKTKTKNITKQNINDKD